MGASRSPTQDQATVQRHKEILASVKSVVVFSVGPGFHLCSLIPKNLWLILLFWMSLCFAFKLKSSTIPETYYVQQTLEVCEMYPFHCSSGLDLPGTDVNSIQLWGAKWTGSKKINKSKPRFLKIFRFLTPIDFRINTFEDLGPSASQSSVLK